MHKNSGHLFFIESLIKCSFQITLPDQVMQIGQLSWADISLTLGHVAKEMTRFKLAVQSTCCSTDGCLARTSLCLASHDRW